MSYLTRILSKVRGGKDKIEPYDYVIDCPSPSDYNLDLILKADAKLISMIWDKSKQAAAVKRGIDVKDKSYMEFQEFEVPQVYYNFLKITIREIVGNCADIFKRDGIILLNYEVKKAKFKVNASKGWDIVISVGGIYSRK
jgi:hypothetical protein